MIPARQSTTALSEKQNRRDTTRAGLPDIRVCCKETAKNTKLYINTDFFFRRYKTLKYCGIRFVCGKWKCNIIIQRFGTNDFFQNLNHQNLGAGCFAQVGNIIKFQLYPCGLKIQSRNRGIRKLRDVRQNTIFFNTASINSMHTEVKIIIKHEIYLYVF